MLLPGFDDVYLGNWTQVEAGTGCTVIVAPQGAIGAVDVAGGAPATRETDLLRPEETVDQVHAVMLSGGSAFGLAASSGAAEELERRSIGLDLGIARVPIVTGACLFDLAVGNPHVRPDAHSGQEAVADALDHLALTEPLMGNLGAGMGCTVGKFLGPDCAMKGGLGWATETAGAVTCTAVAAVNAVGSVFDPATGNPIAGARVASDSEVIADKPLDVVAKMASMPLDVLSADAPRTNTTISCVVANARLTKAQATKVAQMASDGYAHAIVPTHTTNDGDSVFVLATGKVDCPVDVVGVLAQKALAQAIARGCAAAHDAFGFPGAAGR